MNLRSLLENFFYAAVLFAVTGWLVLLAVEAADKEYEMVRMKAERITSAMGK